MKRVVVWVSILLPLLVGIPFVAGGFWLIIEGQRILDDPDVSFGCLVYGGIAFLVGTPFCVGAGCLASRFKPWRSQQPPSDKE